MPNIGDYAVRLQHHTPGQAEPQQDLEGKTINGELFESLLYRDEGDALTSNRNSIPLKRRLTTRRANY
jgi:hypothetical protein